MSIAPAAVPRTALLLGRFRTLRPLGSGGSGSVWLARDEQTGREVTLKIVPREGRAGVRAEREASAAAKLRHPHCLRALARARDAGHVYIAYEYVPGKTLRDAMRSGELDDAAALEAAAQICEGLAHAHAHGIVHRDVKPANVLLADASEISVRILDFGLAQFAEAETLTLAGDVPGTLAYIAPERLSGGAAGPPADVWSVGVLLWEALAGRHPFWAASLPETARLISAGAPSLAEVRPDLPRALVTLVDRALALEPERRPPAAKLASSLRRAGVGEDVRTRPALPARELAERLAPAGLAGLVSAWTASALPFYPEGWFLGLGALAAALAGWRPRVGLAFALAVPVFPLGNVSAGLAWLYAGVALAWLAVSWRDPRGGLLFALGPLLSPVFALGLLPLAATRVRGGLQRAVQVGAAVLAAAAVAGLPRLSHLGVAGSTRPLAVANALWHALAAHPALGVEALVLAAAAVALPRLRGRGPWAIAGFGAALLGAALLPAPELPASPLVVATWVTCGALVWETTGKSAS